jgi:hypothetical protein
LRRTKKGVKRRHSGGRVSEPPESVPSLHELGISRKRAARSKRLAELPQDKRQHYVSELKKLPGGDGDAGTASGQAEGPRFIWRCHCRNAR